MKFFLPTLLFICSFYACTSSATLPKETEANNKMNFEPNEDGEYDIVVFDPQYEVYLKTIALPQSYNSYENYRRLNRIYAIIWNQRHMMPSV